MLTAVFSNHVCQVNQSGKDEDDFDDNNSMFRIASRIEWFVVRCLSP